TTPRGHEGMALCWACLCSFYALPYGCALTGGPSGALHSWDEVFVRRTTAMRVRANRRHVTLGQPVGKTGVSQELAALARLRFHDDPVTDGVDLLVFSNNNREQYLEVHSLDQPLAEWLRKTVRGARRRTGFSALLQAHRTKDRPGSA